MSLRRRDVEQWMSHRRLPEELRRYYLLYSLFPLPANFPLFIEFCSLVAIPYFVVVIFFNLTAMCSIIYCLFCHTISETGLILVCGQ